MSYRVVVTSCLDAAILVRAQCTNSALMMLEKRGGSAAAPAPPPEVRCPAALDASPHRRSRAGLRARVAHSNLCRTARRVRRRREGRIHATARVCAAIFTSVSVFLSVPRRGPTPMCLKLLACIVCNSRPERRL